jgi:hypothetical protein
MDSVTIHAYEAIVSSSELLRIFASSAIISSDVRVRGVEKGA